MNNLWKVALLVVLATLFTGRSWGEESAFKGVIYNMGKLKPFDSEEYDTPAYLNVQVDVMINGMRKDGV